MGGRSEWSTGFKTITKVAAYTPKVEASLSRKCVIALNGHLYSARQVTDWYEAKNYDGIMMSYILSRMVEFATMMEFALSRQGECTLVFMKK